MHLLLRYSLQQDMVKPLQTKFIRQIRHGKHFLMIPKEKSNIAWENMLKRESKKPAVQEIPEFKENPNFVRNSYQSSNPFQNNRNPSYPSKSKEKMVIIYYERE